MPISTDICSCSSPGYDMRFVYEQPMTIGKCDMGLTGNPGIKGGVCGVTYDLHGDIGVPKTAEEGDDWWLSTWEEVMDNVDGKDEPLRNLGIGETYQLNEVTDIKWVEWDVHGKPINTGHEVGVWGQGAVHSFTSASYGLTCGTLLQDQLDNVPHGVAITFHAMTTVGKPLVMKVGWQYDMTCNSLPIDTGSYVIVGQVVVVDAVAQSDVFCASNVTTEPEPDYIGWFIGWMTNLIGGMGGYGQ